MKKVTLLTPLLAASLAACTAKAPQSAPVASTSAAPTTAAQADKSYLVGIVQLVQHPALDAASQGFQDALKDAFGDRVTFDYQNASGDSATATTIANQFVTEQVDLILANATPALQAAASATNTIPVLGTAITEYGVALDLKDFQGTVGTNVSGTSDLAPLDQQAAIFDELLPDAKKIGILFCSGEPNSFYQADVIKGYLEDAGKEVTIYTFADSNDVASVTQAACNEVDALYIPTDNTAASSAEAIDNIASNANVPIIAGEEGIMKGCGVATLTIDYYELGQTTGKMAARILNGEEQVSEMPIEYAPSVKKEFVKERCEKLGITVPSDYTAVEVE